MGKELSAFPWSYGTRASHSHAQGARADVIAYELADNAVECLPELIAAYRDAANDDVRLYVMRALEIAKPPEAVAFMVEVLRSGDAACAAYAERALKEIDTREARTALWDATHSQHGVSRHDDRSQARNSSPRFWYRVRRIVASAARRSNCGAAFRRRTTAHTVMQSQ